MTRTRCVFDLSHNNPLPTSTYAADLPLFQAAQAGGWPAMFHKLSQGRYFQDPVALGRLPVAVNAGLCVGGYHYMTTDPVSSQVANFLSMVGKVRAVIGATIPFVLAIDNEPNPPTPLTDQTAAEFAQAICDGTGIWPVVYGGRYTFYSSATCGALLACPLWLAEYGTNPVCPQGWINWMFHQYSDGVAGPNPQSIPGIGAVDQSEFAGSIYDLLTWWSRQ